MTLPPLPPPERRRALAAQVAQLTESIQTDAAELRRLVRSFLRRPQIVYLRELLRTGPARRSPETEAAWKGMRQALLPLLEKGEVQEAEWPWFLAWACRTTISRPLAPERPAFVDRPRPGDHDRRPADRGPRPDSRPPGPGRFEGRPGGGPRDGRGGRFDRRPDRGEPRGVRMPPQPREVDSRWEQLKNFKFEDDSEKD